VWGYKVYLLITQGFKEPAQRHLGVCRRLIKNAVRQGRLEDLLHCCLAGSRLQVGVRAFQDTRITLINVGFIIVEGGIKNLRRRQTHVEHPPSNHISSVFIWPCRSGGHQAVRDKQQPVLDQEGKIPLPGLSRDESFQRYSGSFPAGRPIEHHG